MRSIRKFALMGVAALLVCAAMASSAFALEAYDNNGTTNPKLGVPTGITGSSTGNTVLSGTFFGQAVTVTCTGSMVDGTLDHNAFAPDTVVSGSIGSATWTGCSSAFKNPCAVTAAGLPWDMTNSGGIEATSTTAVKVAPGTSGAVDVSDCMPFGSTCTMTGAVATAGFTTLSNVVPFAWNNTLGQMSVSGAGNVKAKTCTASGPQWAATYDLTVKSNGDKVGLR